MVSDKLNKEKLMSRLKQTRCEGIDFENEARMWYQLGRNSVTDPLMVEIASGDFDVEE